MYIRPEQIAEQYEMEVKSISKGRDCFLCETDLCQGRRGTELSAIVSFPWSRVRYEEQGGHGVCGKTARWFT